ncbi:MAG: hypothetical protein AABY22_28425 [Nanoarchaeota archaeon]
MPSLISNSQKVYLTGALNDHFDSFKRNIIVYKEPKKTVTNINTANVLPGYENSSNISNITYTIVSGTYPAQITYLNQQKGRTLEETKAFLEDDRLRIKVKQDCKNYINQGKTENITVDGNAYNLRSSDAEANYLGLKFYTYILEKTK